MNCPVCDAQLEPSSLNSHIGSCSEHGLITACECVACGARYPVALVPPNGTPYHKHKCEDRPDHGESPQAPIDFGRSVHDRLRDAELMSNCDDDGDIE